MAVTPQLIPLTEAPSQTVNVTLGNQVCQIDVYSRGINIPKLDPLTLPTDPPTFENATPVFLNLRLNDVLLLGGVLCLSGVRMVRDSYFGFIGDLSFIDTQSTGIPGDPFGVSYRLPPSWLRNLYQLGLPLKLAGLAPPQLANKCPGLGSRFLLLYWPDLK